MKRVICCGSRARPGCEAEVQRLIHGLVEQLQGEGPVELVVGGAGGADHWFEASARRLGVPVLVMPAQWGRGRSAGIQRNQAMAQLPGVTGVIAVWDGASSGTAHMMAVARQLGLTIQCYYGPLQPMLTASLDSTP